MEAADEERHLLDHLPPQDGDSLYTCDGSVDINKQPALKQSTGNWRACFFILGIQFSECISFSAISKNLVTYLTGVLHESNVDAARNVSTWIGSSYFIPLVGAFIADTYWGKYWTIVVFLSVYAVGMLVLTVSTSLPSLLQSPNYSGIHSVVVYMGLYVIAVGNGGIKPCTSAFGADQFDIADSVERVKKGSFFNWFYFSISIGSLLSTTVLVWVQDNVGWGIGFAIPMVVMSLGFAVFVAGRGVYRYKKLGESPMTRVSRVVVAAVRNYHLKLPDDSSALNELASPSEANCKVQHTSQFRFFDKAAIVPPPPDKKGAAASPWRLCTVSQVEELKMLLRLCPVWVAMVPFFMINAQMSSTFIEQGMAMNNRVGPFAVPPASLASFEMVSTLILIPVYDAVLVPLARRATGKDRGISQLQRIGVGIALSALGMAYSALLETKRLASAAPVSIMWQAPAYAVLGAGEVFTFVGMLEFFYDQSPDAMKSLCTALGQLAAAAGNYLNSAVLGLVASTTARGGAAGWIPDDLDQGHLDYFFWVMAALGVLNLLQFLSLLTTPRCVRYYSFLGEIINVNTIFSHLVNEILKLIQKVC